MSTPGDPAFAGSPASAPPPSGQAGWHIHAACDPAMAGLLPEIVRTWHNWLWRSPKDGKTAAERLGLARGEIREDHILGDDMRLAVEQLWRT